MVEYEGQILTISGNDVEVVVSETHTFGCGTRHADRCDCSGDPVVKYMTIAAYLQRWPNNRHLVVKARLAKSLKD